MTFWPHCPVIVTFTTGSTLTSESQAFHVLRFPPSVDSAAAFVLLARADCLPPANTAVSLEWKECDSALSQARHFWEVGRAPFLVRKHHHTTPSSIIEFDEALQTKLRDWVHPFISSPLSSASVTRLPIPHSRINHLKYSVHHIPQIRPLLWRLRPAPLYNLPLLVVYKRPCRPARPVPLVQLDHHLGVSRKIVIWLPTR